MPDENLPPILKSGIIYEIYPRSFRSAHGRRDGDLRGITQKLDYLEWLGVKQIWLPPVYPSPMKDGGYDVADYYGINPMFGTLGDFDELVREARGRGIGVIMDLVVNHTSSRHEWFQEALKSPDSPMRARYIFRQAKPGGGLPNNHLSVFGGPAWEPVPGEPDIYYYHTFDPGQPDLNWDDPAVLTEMSKVMKFWFDRGVAGIRVDAVHFIGKPPDMPDEPENPDWDGKTPYSRLEHIHTQYQPGMFKMVGELCKVVADYGHDRFVVFETSTKDVSTGTYKRFYQEAVDRRVAAPFHFGLFFADWSAPAIKAHLDEFLGAIPEDSVPIWNISNHDQHRVASRIGEQQAWVAMALILTLPGVATLYYGDEIGMVDGPPPEPGKSDDPQVGEFSRDVARTPMQWNNDEATSAGFTKLGVKPWLPVNPDFRSRNVEAMQQNPRSILNYTKTMMELRKLVPTFERGSYVPLESGADGVLAFGRKLGRQQATVLLNFTGESQEVKVPAETPRLLFSQRAVPGTLEGTITLSPNEVCVLHSQP